MLNIVNRCAILDGIGNFGRDNIFQGKKLPWTDPAYCRVQANSIIVAHMMGYTLMDWATLPEGASNLIKETAQNLVDNKEEAIEFAYRVFCMLGPAVEVKEDA